MRLAEYYQRAEETRRAATNLLQQARIQFDQVIANTNGQFAARAQLDCGWCLWEESQVSGSTNAIADGLAAFRAAAEQLPHSADQAVARFKWADCQFTRAAYAGALTNYWMVATHYADLPSVRCDLVGPALYQIVRASIALGDLASADAAVTEILSQYPAGELNDRSLLLYGQALSRLSNPAAARIFFADFMKRFPQSLLLPEVELAIARTYEQEENWQESSRLYDEWVARHADHSSRPKAEFGRAWATYQAGKETNAFVLFTNYVAQFPSHNLAPLAQLWAGDYFYRQGNYAKAEESYQKVYQNTNWQRSELSFHAWMMAGRAAYARQGYNDAANYFRNLIDNLIKLDRPSSLLPEAYYALADTYIRYPESVPGSTNAPDSFREAIVALDKIVREYPTHALAPLAWGRIGDCYLQLAAADAENESANYAKASQAYSKASESERADVSCRSNAEVGLATVLEKQAEQLQLSPGERTNLLNDALGHYLYVVYGKNLREGEVADPFWLKVAAQAAARLAEDQQRWDVATDLYRRLIVLLPPLRKTWELKLERLTQARLQTESAKK